MCFGGNMNFGALKGAVLPKPIWEDKRPILVQKTAAFHEFHKEALTPDIPPPPQTPTPPQGARAPDTTPLKRRNVGGGYSVPSGSTLLTGQGGVAGGSLNLGGSTLLGGG